MRKLTIVMAIETLKTVAPLAVALAFVGCANPQPARIASSKMLPKTEAATERPPNASIRPASFNEPTLNGVTQHSRSVGPLPEVAVEALAVDVLPRSNEVDTADVVDLETLVAMSLSSNPAVAQAEAALAQASSIYCQVGLKPNPSVGYFGQELGNDDAGGQHGVFASQTIVLGDKLRWNRCVTSHEVNRLKWEAETQRRRVETDVRIRFYRALAAQQRLHQAQRFRKNAVMAVDVARKRLDAKEGTKPDLLQSQLLVDQIDLSIRQSELEWLAAWAELTATIGQPSMQPSSLVGEFVEADISDLNVFFDEAVAASPQLMAAKASISRARTNLQRQRNQTVPNVGVQLGVGVDDSTDDTFANVQLGMPLLIHNRNQGNIAAARSEFAAATQNLRRLELRLRRDLAQVLRRYQSSAVAIDTYENKMLPRAEESLALVEEARRAGEIEFLRVLTARQTLFELQQKLIIEKAELSQAEAEMTGYLLTDALGTEVVYDGDDSSRGRALSGQ